MWNNVVMDIKSVEARRKLRYAFAGDGANCLKCNHLKDIYNSEFPSSVSGSILQSCGKGLAAPTVFIAAMSLDDGAQMYKRALEGGSALLRDIASSCGQYREEKCLIS